MSARPVRLFAVAMLATALLAAPVGAAGAAQGTFTKITTPSGTTTFQFIGAGPKHFTVSGQASADVTSVDIVCIIVAGGGNSSTTMASAVPVTAEAFSTSVDYSSPTANCRLRAVPVGVDLTSDYLGSYAGPILYTDAFLAQIDGGSTKYGYTAVAEEADGISEQQDAGSCGVVLVSTVATPGMELRGTGTSSCKFALPAQSLVPNATASSIKVSGHNAYLPSGVHNFLIGTQALSVTQSVLTTTFTVAANGDVTITESAPLMRCSGSDLFPPTSGSCPSLVSTGVKFTRKSQVIRGAHQVRIRDTFASTDSASHTLTLEYQHSVQPPQSGATGYVFPGHGTTFATAAPDQVVTGLGTKAASMLIRSDVYSVNGDPSADTVALTWSKAPPQIVFAHSGANQFDMKYALTVPASGTAFLGFADSQNVSTAGAQSLGSLASGDMINAPTISSPANGAVLSSTSTTVKGNLTAGANGLPTAVVVAGHHATITRTSATTATYQVTFTESVGAHTFNAIATDSAGNAKASNSITVHNQ
jgi:hypothetical protein